MHGGLYRESSIQGSLPGEIETQGTCAAVMQVLFFWATRRIHAALIDVMTPTTHIASSCLLTAAVVRSGTGEAAAFAVLSVGSLALHFLLDCIPHGFITTPWTIFKKFLPTALELFPGPLILAASILIFGHPLLFAFAAAFSLVPDICSTLVWNRKRGSALPAVRALHRLHRLVHWFETDHPDGSVTHMFANRPLLAVEACLLALIISALYQVI